MIRFVLVFLFILTSCSSFDSEARAKWIKEDLPNEEKEWRICSEKYDGIEYHRKGFCYKIRECRKRFLRKRECRPILQFCKFGDDACFDKHGLFDKRLM